ncbi:MAG: DNA polymerase ligase N-terminal domain-containing protein [Promethearchaeota archaeon]
MRDNKTPQYVIHQIVITAGANPFTFNPLDQILTGLRTKDEPPLAKPYGNCHMDLSLEKGDRLESWELFGIIPEEKGQHCLAKKSLLPRPTTWARFEGQIAGYHHDTDIFMRHGRTGGKAYVIMWDHGTYTTAEWTDREITINIHGKRLTGKYSLTFYRTPLKQDLGEGRVSYKGGHIWKLARY